MIEGKIYAHLSTTVAVTALSSNRIFPVVLPQDVAFPSLTYQRVTGGREYTLGGYADLENPLIQIDCWATAFEECRNLSTAVIRSMFNASDFSVTVTNRMAEYSDEASLHREILEFSVWSRS